MIGHLTWDYHIARFTRGRIDTPAIEKRSVSPNFSMTKPGDMIRRKTPIRAVGLFARDGIGFEVMGTWHSRP